MKATGTNAGLATPVPAALAAAGTVGSTGGAVRSASGWAAGGQTGGDVEDVPVEVGTRRIRADEALLLRELRLMALRDAPAAFAGGVAAELAVQPDEWACRARDCASRQDDFVAIVNRFGTPSGLVRAYSPASEPDRRELTAMWVAPWARGIGAGDALVETVVAWAEQVGASAVTLWVNVENAAAQRLYARHGFAVAGEPAGDPDERRWLPMRLALRAAATEAGHTGLAEPGLGGVGQVAGSRLRW
jgi:ribosomal protein S18 acetylase RimI-like enzyme